MNKYINFGRENAQGFPGMRSKPCTESLLIFHRFSFDIFCHHFFHFFLSLSLHVGWLDVELRYAGINFYHLLFALQWKFKLASRPSPDGERENSINTKHFSCFLMMMLLLLLLVLRCGAMVYYYYTLLKRPVGNTRHAWARFALINIKRTKFYWIDARCSLFFANALRCFVLYTMKFVPYVSYYPSYFNSNTAALSKIYDKITPNAFDARQLARNLILHFTERE